MAFSSLRICAVSALLFCSMNGATAAESRCPEHYAAARPPAVLDAAIAVGSQELCSLGYGVLYSAEAKSPIFAAEYLSPDRVFKAYDRRSRSNDFRPDERIARRGRASLEDYRGSGFDRGHLAPSADMDTAEADSESFLLTNIVPQDPQLNRNLWAAIEKAVRALAKHRPVYVVTGVIWEPNTSPTVGRGRVRVPAYLYKAVYDPATRAGAAYLVANAPNQAHRELTLAQLSQVAGISPFPGAHVTSTLRLPRPRY
ncbi:DNA/RNA non-specific endonuclease [Achromobacter sp. DH1f]|uniref:DNA/RNA non-specific endonuclease n=1 Tax=Achromobacter sp. DH1f TaxID=1397275 RepID=UPI00046910A2|nr:DNA/RNA non-specific endonuclease [Achromobacter sp. DH1f]